MSHKKVKTTYNVEGSYGSIEEVTLYADHNNSADYVLFYDENGEFLFEVPDTIDNNLFDAIERLYILNSDKGVFENVGAEEWNRVINKSSAAESAI